MTSCATASGAEIGLSKTTTAAAPGQMRGRGFESLMPLKALKEVGTIGIRRGRLESYPSHSNE